MSCCGGHLARQAFSMEKRQAQTFNFLVPGVALEEFSLYAFCSDMKFKMAATAGLSLTLDPMGKMLLL
jgi:hypothetical protein